MLLVAKGSSGDCASEGELGWSGVCVCVCRWYRSWWGVPGAWGLGWAAAVSRALAATGWRMGSVARLEMHVWVPDESPQSHFTQPHPIC